MLQTENNYCIGEGEGWEGNVLPREKGYLLIFRNGAINAYPIFLEYSNKVQLWVQKQNSWQIVCHFSWKFVSRFFWGYFVFCEDVQLRFYFRNNTSPQFLTPLLLRKIHLVFMHPELNIFSLLHSSAKYKYIFDTHY